MPFQGVPPTRMLISEMGGRIEVRSALGQRTTFTVVLNPADAKKNAKRH
jgi:signal transduction histidine kinase